MKTEQEIRKHLAAVKKIIAQTKSCGCARCTLMAEIVSQSLPVFEWVLDNNPEYDLIAENAASAAAQLPG